MCNKVADDRVPIEWYPNKWWKFCVLEDEKKEIEPVFTGGLYK